MEQAVFDARCNGQLSFSQLDSEGRLMAVRSIVLAASAISGLPVMSNILLLDELEAQLSKYILNFGFDNLTHSEMEIALQLNLSLSITIAYPIEISSIEPFGSHVNVSFISKVFQNYKSLRNHIDNKLKKFIDGNGYNY